MVPTGTGWGCIKFGGSSIARGRVAGKRPPPFQAQGAAGRHHQGGQASLLLPEARRKKARQGSLGPQTQPQESAQRTGIVRKAAFPGSGLSISSSLHPLLCSEGLSC